MKAPPDEPWPAPRRSTCSSCGAVIWWVKLPSGKFSPVNHERILIRLPDAPEDPNDDLGPIDERGPATIVTADGRILTGKRIAAQYDPGKGVPLPEGVEVGGRSHFATCPEADKHRRKKRAEKRAQTGRARSGADQARR